MFMLRRFASFVCVAGSLAAAASGAGVPAAPGASRAGAVLGRLPLHFEPNQGQWNSDVKYAARTSEFTLSLTGTGAVLSHPGSARRLEMSLVRAASQARAEGVDPLASRSNYFVGGREKWRTQVPHYSRVRYKGVYPGIDVVYYGSGETLEYDFVLQPGADPRKIRLKFRGAEKIAVTAEGDLALDCAGARVVQKKPLLYQEGAERREVAGRYVMLSRNEVGVRVDSYDRSRTLVIDPVLTYASFLGGSARDGITGVKADSKGILYVTGWTASTDLPASESAEDLTNSGLMDGFVAKLDPSVSGPGSLLYLTYFGGALDDSPQAIDVDAAGNIYVVGATQSTDFPVAGASAQATYAGQTTSDAFAIKLNPALGGTDALVYSTYLAGADIDIANGVAVDAAGMIYVIGTTRSVDFPVTANAYQRVTWGKQDMFLTKIDPGSSTLPYSTYLGGELGDVGRAIAVTPAGKVYFAGSTVSTTFPLGGNPYRQDLLGGVDVVIGVMDMTKSGVDSLLYSTYFGGGDLDDVGGIALDASGKLLVVGYTLSRDLPVTSGALQPSLAGNSDAFVALVDPSASSRSAFLRYVTYLGGSAGDVAYSVAADSAGSVYVTGYTLSSDFPVTGDAAQMEYGGGVDVFVTKLSPATPGPGALQYSTYLGTTGVQVGMGLALAPDGGIYVGGYTTGTTPTLAGAAQPVFTGGQYDGFVAVLK